MLMCPDCCLYCADFSLSYAPKTDRQVCFILDLTASGVLFLYKGCHSVKILEEQQGKWCHDAYFKCWTQTQGGWQNSEKKNTFVIDLFLWKQTDIFEVIVLNVKVNTAFMMYKLNVTAQDYCMCCRIYCAYVCSACLSDTRTINRSSNLKRLQSEILGLYQNNGCRSGEQFP